MIVHETTVAEVGPIHFFAIMPVVCRNIYMYTSKYINCVEGLVRYWSVEG